MNNAENAAVYVGGLCVCVCVCVCLMRRGYCLFFFWSLSIWFAGLSVCDNNTKKKSRLEFYWVMSHLNAADVIGEKQPMWWDRKTERERKRGGEGGRREREKERERERAHARIYAQARGGGLGSRPKKMYGERLGDGVEYHLMKPTLCR